MARDGRRVLGQGNPFTLTAGAIEHTCPEPQRWQIRAPKAGTHDPLLEDLAGNNLLGPFEVDRDAPAKAAKTTTLGFEIQ